MNHRILYLNKTPDIGGAEISLLSLVKRLDRKEFVPIVLVPTEGALNEHLKSIGVHVITVPLYNIHLKRLNPFNYIITVLRLRKIIKDENISLVHTNDTPSGQYGIAASKLSGVPIICHVRELMTRRTVKRAFLSLADKVIANSKITANTFLTYNNDPQKVDVVYNGVDITEYIRDDDEGKDFRKRFGIEDDTFLIGVVGRIFPNKGFHIALEALNEIRKEHNNTRLIIIGSTGGGSESKYQKDGKYVEGLKKLISSFSMERHVIFAGFQKDMIPAYKAMDLLVFPTFTESFGRVLIEAMAAEKPVIASAVGGILEIVDDGVTGLLFPPGDVLCLTEKIIAIMKDQEKAQQMGIAGRKRVQDLFSIEKHVKGVVHIYRKTLKMYYEKKGLSKGIGCA